MKLEIPIYQKIRYKIYEPFAYAKVPKTFPNHFHKQPEIIYCMRGRIVITQETQTIVLNRGDIAIVCPYVAHSFIKSNGNGICMGIPLQFANTFIKYFTCLNANQFVIKNSKNSFDLQSTLMRFKGANNLNFINQRALIDRLLDEMLELIDIDIKQSIEQIDLASKIIFFLDENYTQDITMQTLMDKFMYSRSYLSEYFNNIFKCSLPAYLTNLRLSAFFDKQRTSGGSISDNALSVGFKSSRTFYNNFMTEFKITPTEYFKLIK